MIDGWAYAIVCGIAFLSSVISTSVGVGGSLLLVSLATAVPVAVAIPIHACVALIGSLSRWALLHRYVDVAFVVRFSLGAIIGIGLAWPVVGRLPTTNWELLLGAFLLIVTWWKPSAPALGREQFIYVYGAVVSFCSVFVGAVKPMLATTLMLKMDDHRNVAATTNASATLPHIGKIVLFTAISVAFLDYWKLIISMLAASVLGSLVGRRLLLSKYVDLLRYSLKAVITVLAIKLVITGLGTLITLQILRFILDMFL